MVGMYQHNAPLAGTTHGWREPSNESSASCLAHIAQGWHLCTCTVDPDVDLNPDPGMTFQLLAQPSSAVTAAQQML